MLFRAATTLIITKKLIRDTYKVVKVAVVKGTQSVLWCAHTKASKFPIFLLLVRRDFTEKEKFRLQFVSMDEKVGSLSIFPSRNSRVMESLYVSIIGIKMLWRVKQNVRFLVLHL